MHTTRVVTYLMKSNNLFDGYVHRTPDIKILITMVAEPNNLVDNMYRRRVSGHKSEPIIEESPHPSNLNLGRDNPIHYLQTHYHQALDICRNYHQITRIWTPVGYSSEGLHTCKVKA